MNKIFPLRTILTVTTGRLLTKPRSDSDNGISDLYELLAHMTGESPFTHTLGRFSDECKPKLLKWFPELNKANLLELDRLLSEPDGINKWISKCVEKWSMSEEYSIASNTIEAHESKNPVTELAGMIAR